MTAEKPIVYKTQVEKLTHMNDVHYLEVPAPVIKQLGGTLKVRLLCTINNKLTFPCGPVALENGCGYISINRKRLKELGIGFKDKIQVALIKDPSKYGMEMPEELSELLQQDKEGNKRFKSLPSGKQRYIIYYVNTVKSSQLRINRAIKLIENLKKTKPGKESFREMLGKEL